eukprot:CAMPEP_0177189414 /NCGR_PEP_ID=MMETSP0367-20130122/20253_1 /TAXON_ID=447022 ORGANISM="Scrippsiella hangoei-like, Strain SHHI-4" /NCGR_SAMPLE_ID=MMETSP0367 /ASSEMBLY_ACC=CAM_ASM_000362 /LENGTH=412 /DNA_ID=CAMNT_0018636945 /DNA_START=40 /DNA_END=1278 /DNA_ORIENTATION=-
MAVVSEGYPQQHQQQQPRRQQQISGAQHAPPGWFGNGTVQPRPKTVMVAHVPRRFPAHFAPHRLCNHFSAHGWCRKADTCTFAHGLQELHPDLQVQFVQPVVVSKGKGKGKQKGAARAELQDPATFAWSANAAPFEIGAGFAFNVGASEFVPMFASDEARANTDYSQEDEEDNDEEEDEPGVADAWAAAALDSGTAVAATSTRADSDSPDTRRPIPAPLQLDESTPMGAASAAVPAAVVISSQAAPHRVLMSPMKVTSVRLVPGQLLASPKAVVVASPTRSFASGRPMPVLASPSSQAMGSMLTPSRGAPTAFMLQSPSGLPWSGGPVLASPTGAAMPSTPVPISRNMLLQARYVVKRLEQGPPGLAHFAPTPTTKARRIGFRYPQPGGISTIASIQQTNPQHLVKPSAAKS